MNDQQKQEIEALESIYPAEFHVLSSSDLDFTLRCGAETDPTDDDGKDEKIYCRLRIKLSEEYPAKNLPFYEFDIPRPVFHYHEGASIATIRGSFEEAIKDLFIPGEVVLFSWFECFRDIVDPLLQSAQEHLAQEEAEQNEWIARLERERDKQLAARSSHHPANAIELQQNDDDENLTIFQYVDGCPPIRSTSEPVVVKKSVFVAHVAYVTSLEDVKKFRHTLLSNKKIARATHNILAYRISLDSNNGAIQDYDDDGETAAGSRLLELLRITQAVNVVVVVSRWYGGVQLGPLRFKVINNVARELLSSCKYIS